jgi:hypothetical protein
LSKFKRIKTNRHHERYWIVNISHTCGRNYTCGPGLDTARKQ